MDLVTKHEVWHERLTDSWVFLYSSARMGREL